MSMNFEHPKSRRRITDLDDNLVIEILSHQPYEQVMVSKSVCKLWNSLISTPYFVRRFLRHRLRITDSLDMREEQPLTFMYSQSKLDYSMSKNVPKLTSRDSIFRSPGFSLSFVPCFHLQQEAICVVSTFNDLILCCAKKYRQRTYYICNPITMQYVALPPAPSISYELTELCVDFICEPYYQKHHQNEDIDVVLNTQYRFWVMRVENFVTRHGLTIQIFSSETGRWDEFPVSIPDGFADFGEYSYRVNSLAFHGNNLLITIIEFNQTHVRPRLIKMWYPNTNPNFKHQLRPLGKFALAPNFEFYRKPEIKIWELDENEFEWRFANRVHLSEIISRIDVSENFRQIFEQEFVWATYTDVLGLDSHNQNVVYLNVDNEDIGMVRFDTQRRTLVLLRNNHVVQVDDDTHHRFGMDFFQIVVPFWPTPMPKILAC